MCKDSPRTSSQASAHGTACHSIAESCLRGHLEAIDFVGEIHKVDGFDIQITVEDAGFIQVYVDAVRAAALFGTLSVEGEVDTSDVLCVPGQKGTTDAAILNIEDGSIEVHDLKMGHHKVYAAHQPDDKEDGRVEPNPQLGIYALAVLLKYSMLADWKTVKIVIHQPRAQHYDEATFSVDDLLAWGSGVAYTAKVAHKLYTDPSYNLKNYLVPGKHCTDHYCPVRGSCSARVEQLADAFPTLEAQSLSQLPLVTEERLAELYERAEAIDQLIADIKKEAFARAMAGKKVPGLKLVTGKKGDRKWKDVEAVKPLLPAEAFLPATPAAVEKLMRKNFAAWAALQQHISQADGGPTLASADDKRPEWTKENKVANAFAAIDSNNADGLI